MIDLVIGGQFGSEGKGSVVSWLARHHEYDLAMRVGSPNSGHTVVAENGHVYKLRQLPCVWPFQGCDLYLPAANVIDLDILHAEIEQARLNGFTGDIVVSSGAGVLESRDVVAEVACIRTGTTASGSGSLRARKLMRQAKLFGDYDTNGGHDNVIDNLQRDDSRILAETTQGYGLSLDGGYYPYCTSINLDPYHLLGDLEVPYGIHGVNVWMVIRTFPIRIAGNSGPLEAETTWDRLREDYGSHIPDERTTVTNMIRRVGNFDSRQVAIAVRRLRPTYIVLNFFDYRFPEFNGHDLSDDMRYYLNGIRTSIGQRISHIGYGPGKIVAMASLATAPLKF